MHYTRKATGYVVVVSDFLMTSLAKVTVKVGKGVRDAVAESEVGVCLCAEMFIYNVENFSYV